MTQVLRLLQSAIDPADVEVVRRLFTDDILPAYANFPGCLGVELLLSVEHSPGGLILGAALTRWQDREAMEEAVASRPAQEAQVRVFELLRQEPVVRVFEVVA